MIIIWSLLELIDSRFEWKLGEMWNRLKLKGYTNKKLFIIINYYCTNLVGFRDFLFEEFRLIFCRCDFVSHSS